MLDPALYKQPTAKRLVLSLLSSPDLREISARQCAHWGTLFAIEPAAMRVALGRLVKAGFLRSTGRGRYAIGERGRALSEAARSWVDAEARLERWSGMWLLAYTGHLGRRDKAALTARERALALEGFAALHPGLWCRPANFCETLTATRERLMELGLEPGALMLRAERPQGAAALEDLWPRKTLELRYRKLTGAMRASMRGLRSESVDAAARETFLLGEAVIRQINNDPLLPDSMIDVRARRKMHETMVAYDAVGRAIWERFQDGL